LPCERPESDSAATVIHSQPLALSIERGLQTPKGLRALEHEGAGVRWILQVPQLDGCIDITYGHVPPLVVEKRPSAPAATCRAKNADSRRVREGGKTELAGFVDREQPVASRQKGYG
jgi:hypothetical protein